MEGWCSPESTPIALQWLTAGVCVAAWASVASRATVALSKLATDYRGMPDPAILFSPQCSSVFVRVCMVCCLSSSRGSHSHLYSICTEGLASSALSVVARVAAQKTPQAVL
eukprot:scpid43461/ scgid24394/ 